MIKATVVAAIALVAIPASARQCTDLGGGAYTCDDGSYGNLVGDTLYLNVPRTDGPPEMVPMNCYRDASGALHCG